MRSIDLEGHALSWPHFCNGHLSSINENTADATAARPSNTIWFWLPL